jgi:hypothetical protein
VAGCGGARKAELKGSKCFVFASTIRGSGQRGARAGGARRQECFAFQLAAALVKPAISGGHDERLAYLRAADPQRAEDSRLAREGGCGTRDDKTGQRLQLARGDRSLRSACVVVLGEPNCGFTAQMVQVGWWERDGMEQD